MAIKKINFGAILILVLTMIQVSAFSQNPVYIGTYTKEEGHVDGKASGIYLLNQDISTGKLNNIQTVAEITNPSFVKLSKDGKNLYAVSELGDQDAESGFIYSFKRNDDNSLEEIGKISTESFAPCHITIDNTGNYVFVSNYVGGVMMMYSRNDNGILEKQQKIVLENPENSHPHSVNITADNKTAYLADLGNDKIWIFHFDAEYGILNPHRQEYVQLEEGAGPRHFTFSEDERFAWSINELNSTISLFKIEENGGLNLKENYANLPQDFSGNNSTADIHLHPSGEFLYTSNRGHNSIAAFSVNQNSGQLQLIDHFSTRGETPRNFSISPDGNFLYAANQDSGNISAFQIDTETGKLSLIQDLRVKSPVCVEFTH